MALTADQITALNFHDYHQMILPYLNGGGVGLKLLWENPNPTASFAAQNITLSSSDYDLLLIVARLATTSVNAVSQITTKGLGSLLMRTDKSSTAVNCGRLFTYVDDTTLNANNAYINNTNDNTKLIPYRIYGIKAYNRDVQSDYEIIDGTIDSIGANAKKTITLSPTIPTGKKVIGWSMYAVDSDLQTYMQYYGGNYILCVKNIGNNAMTNKDYRVVFIYGQ